MQDYESWKKSFDSKEDLYRSVYHFFADQYYWYSDKEENFVKRGLAGEIKESAIRECYDYYVHKEKANRKLFDDLRMFGEYFAMMEDKRRRKSGQPTQKQEALIQAALVNKENRTLQGAERKTGQAETNIVRGKDGDIISEKVGNCILWKPRPKNNSRD